MCLSLGGIGSSCTTSSTSLGRVDGSLGNDGAFEGNSRRDAVHHGDLEPDNGMTQRKEHYPDSAFGASCRFPFGNYKNPSGIGFGDMASVSPIP